MTSSTPDPNPSQERAVNAAAAISATVWWGVNQRNHLNPEIQLMRNNKLRMEISGQFKPVCYEIQHLPQIKLEKHSESLDLHQAAPPPIDCDFHESF